MLWQAVAGLCASECPAEDSGKDDQPNNQSVVHDRVPSSRAGRQPNREIGSQCGREARALSSHQESSCVICLSPHWDPGQRISAVGSRSVVRCNSVFQHDAQMRQRRRLPFALNAANYFHSLVHTIAASPRVEYLPCTCLTASRRSFGFIKTARRPLSLSLASSPCLWLRWRWRWCEPLRIAIALTVAVQSAPLWGWLKLEGRGKFSLQL